MAEILVLGAGAAGISAAYHAAKAGKETVLLEKRDRYGGLCDHFHKAGFRFDHAVHFAFSKNEAYSALLEKTDLLAHRPQAYNYEQGRWLKHPVQNNLYPLPVEEKVEAIKSFIERPARRADSNYHSWLYEQFGTVIADRYPARYTLKYWTVPPESLSTDWIGNRLHRPSLEEVLFGAMTDATPLTYYLPEFYYPRRGGFKAIFEPLMEDLELRTGKEVVRIDPARRIVECRDGTFEDFEYLVSSLPLPEITKMIDNAPLRVLKAAGELWATAIALVSIGLKVPQAGDHLWFYIYDQEILPARAHAPYRKSPDNAPAGCSSLQFEIYFSRHKPLPLTSEALLEHVTGSAEKMGLFKVSDLAVTDCRILPYANVVFEKGMQAKRKLVRDYLEQKGILSVGRFGEWDYLWTDQCYLSGKKVENLPCML